MVLVPVLRTAARVRFVRDLVLGVGIGTVAARIWWFQNHPEGPAHLNNDKLYAKRHLWG